MADPTFPINSILDTFSRANENPLSDGGKWTTPSDTTLFAPLQISSNQAASTNANKIAQGFWNPAFYQDCEVFVDIPVLPPTNGCGIAFRSPDFSGKNGYVVEYYNGVSALFSGAGGVWTQIGSAISQTFSAGDSLGAQMIGNICTIWRKTGGVWSSLGSITDTSNAFPNAGYVGCFIDGDSAARLANFGAGPVTGAGGSLNLVQIENWWERTAYKQ